MIDLNKLKNANEVDFPGGLSNEEKGEAKFYAAAAVFVRKKREELGLTQSEFSRKFGVSQSTVSKIENGDDGVSMKSVAGVVFSLGGNISISDTPKKPKYDTSVVVFANKYWAASSKSELFSPPHAQITSTSERKCNYDAVCK